MDLKELIFYAIGTLSIKDLERNKINTDGSEAVKVIAANQKVPCQ